MTHPHDAYRAPDSASGEYQSQPRGGAHPAGSYDASQYDPGYSSSPQGGYDQGQSPYDQGQYAAAPAPGAAAPIVWGSTSATGAPAWSGPSARGGSRQAPVQEPAYQGGGSAVGGWQQAPSSSAGWADAPARSESIPDVPERPEVPAQPGPDVPDRPSEPDSPDQPGNPPQPPAPSPTPSPAPDPASWGAEPGQGSRVPWGEQQRSSAPEAPSSWAQSPASAQYQSPQQHVPSDRRPPAYDGPPAAANAPLAPSEAAEALPTQMTPAVAPQTSGQEAAEEALTIGRGRVNSIVLDDMLVSRQHVRITVDDEGLVLEDLGSRNGTFVNGRRIERTHLHEGDRIGIGASTFEVRDGWLVSI
ncbi:FHA domain-containing protein [Luteipulveratus sp. YIM 133132]|uniref:FHA domain-containing protein n=1 Tax=Luteipulveratus flavus TaxID=3031728 RepID=UPI0023B16BB8|nr:FHA domain-containing protein [Luteipulveratus sp. YIM 133132]MDE9365867.1 FHA domain-containing protein [Luteipulveratus sp. YIM 133132]